MMNSAEDNLLFPWPSRGVIVLAVLLLVSSLMHIQKLAMERDICFYYYGYWPPWLLVTRYSFSWFQRVLGILIAVGLLARKDLARKTAIVLGCFTIATLYWKHHYPAFTIHA